MKWPQTATTSIDTTVDNLRVWAVTWYVRLLSRGEDILVPSQCGVSVFSFKCD